MLIPVPFVTMDSYRLFLFDYVFEIFISMKIFFGYLNLSFEKWKIIELINHESGEEYLKWALLKNDKYLKNTPNIKECVRR